MSRLFLSGFRFPGYEAETSYHFELKLTCFETMYPFGILPPKGLDALDFAPITILCGGNGSGKSTVLNILAEKLALPRETPFNRSSFFGDFVRLCSADCTALPAGSRMLTSDDVFDFMLNLRALNDGVDRSREALYETWRKAQHERVRLESMADYEHLREVVDARRQTMSGFVRGRNPKNVREHSNGESAFLRFTEAVGENALYLLDEPENSLSPQRQAELAQFLEESVRFYGCQLVIATHSPFLLALRGARIYDLDSVPVRVRRWSELENVRAYYEFFRARAGEFDPAD